MYPSVYFWLYVGLVVEHTNFSRSFFDGSLCMDLHSLHLCHLFQRAILRALSIFLHKKLPLSISIWLTLPACFHYAHGHTPATSSVWKLIHENYLNGALILKFVKCSLSLNYLESILRLIMSTASNSFSGWTRILCTHGLFYDDIPTLLWHFEHLIFIMWKLTHVHELWFVASISGHIFICALVIW